VSDGLNIRDLADIPQLIVLANLESHNAEFIRQGIPPKERLMKLREIVIVQLKSLRSINYTYSIDSPYISSPARSTNDIRSESDNVSEG
jgi:hypothetical protein